MPEASVADSCRQPLKGGTVSLHPDLEAITGLPSHERVGPLARMGRQVAEQNGSGDAQLKQRLVAAMASLLEEGAGTANERLDLGEALGLLGDPRVRSNTDDDYWVSVPGEDGPVTIARFPVTNAEYRAFVKDGGYTKRELWGEEGWDWLAATDDPWPNRADNEDSKPFVIDNQPVVGVSWYEAMAFARWADARLPSFEERLWVTRGEERRPYPWGSPFGAGNANTREEVLGRPCAVGLYVNDCTPEGVRDLAGNVAEWCTDGVARDRWIHPGSWQEPSMAAWAKARSPEAPDSRWAGLGFRLAK